MNRLLIVLPVLLLPLPSKSPCNETVLPFERVTLNVSMDTSGWVLGSHQVFEGLTIIEWVPEGETVEQWSSQFRALRYANAMLGASDARRLARNLVEGLSHGCSDPAAIRHKILEADATSALVTWEAHGCEGDNPYSFDQRELTRFIVGKEFTFNLAFTRRLGADQTSEVPPPLLSEQDQIAILRSAVIQRSESPQSVGGIDQELLKIPAYRTYSLFSNPVEQLGRVWFEEVERTGTGRSGKVRFRLKSEALPPDHWYAVYVIKLPQGLAIPVQYGLKLGEAAELVCPPLMEGMPAIDSVTGADFAHSGFAEAFPCEQEPNRSINDTLGFEALGFQAGLALAVGIQSHDASHRYLARAVPRPIRDQDANCRIELELASPDGRTYLLRGSGFEPGETLGGSWRYAKNTQEVDIHVLSDGSFTHPLFHTGKAKGRKKWEAEIRLAGSSCAPGIEYFWGKKGMSK